MASGHGHGGVASGDGKRKRSEGRSRAVCGSGSGSGGDGQEYPGDPPTTHTPAGRRAGAAEDSGFCGVSDVTEELALFGVRARVTVEVKRWAGTGRDFNIDVNVLEGMETLTDVEMRKLVAAIVHDLAQLYWKLWDPERPPRRLNIRHVELLIRKHHLADELLIGGGLLDKVVRDHPLVWVDAVADRVKFEALKTEIAELALPFLKDLKAAIAKELSRAGRQRQDEAQILPFVEEKSEVRAEHAEVRAKHAEVRAEHAEVRAEHAEVRAEHAEVRAERAEVRADHAEVRAERAEVRAEHAEIQRLKARITSLEEELRTAQGGYLFYTNQEPSPTSGVL